MMLWIQWCHREARPTTKGGPRRCLSLCWMGIVSRIGGIVATKDIECYDVERQGTVAGQVTKNSEDVRRVLFAACCSCCCLSMRSSGVVADANVLEATVFCKTLEWLYVLGTFYRHHARGKNVSIAD